MVRISGCRLEGPYSHKFLDLTLDARCNGISQVDVILASASGPFLAIKRLAWEECGSSCGALMNLHSTFVVSRICYIWP